MCASRTSPLHRPAVSRTLKQDVRIQSKDQEIPKPEWDDEVGRSCNGVYILVGITCLDHEGKETQKQQMHGIIESASEEEGIKIQLNGVYASKSWVMPPDERAISEASPGTCTLHLSNEKIVNPDFVSTRTIQDPDPNKRET